MCIFKNLLILMVLLLQACAILPLGQPEYVYIAKGVKFDFIDLHQLKAYHSLNQILEAKYKGKNYSLNLVTEFRQDGMKSVALTKFGAEIFSFSYYNKSLVYNVSPVANNMGKIRPEYVLADMQLVYWPIDAIRNHIKGDMVVKEYKNNGVMRIFYKNGKEIIKITYSNKDKWRARISYQHLERGYEYTLKKL